MLLDERRRTILETLEEYGHASLQELINRVGASESTVRRDLDYLDETGQLRRTRGGASTLDRAAIQDGDSPSRMLREKQAIATRAARLIREAGSILLDGGTTTLELARRLQPASLRVVTNSLPIANLLLPRTDLEVILLGGVLRPQSAVTVGPLLKDALRGIRVRHLLMGAGGITEEGLFNNNTLLVEAEREMMHVAEEVTVLCDSSKFGHVALAKLCPLEQVDRIIVDSGLPDAWADLIEASGVTLDIVPA